MENNASGDATIWVNVDPKIPAQTFATQSFNVPFVIDNGGIAITTGLKGKVGPFAFPWTITKWSLLGDQTGSIVVDLYKCTYSAWDPPTTPTVAQSITAAAKPTISSAKKGQSATLTGWNVNVAAGEIIAFNVDSITNLQNVTVMLDSLRV